MTRQQLRTNERKWRQTRHEPAPVQEPSQPPQRARVTWRHALALLILAASAYVVATVVIDIARNF